MNEISQGSVTNRILRSMPSEVFALLAPNLERMDLPMSTALEEPGRSIDFVVFFEKGIGSNIVVGTTDHQTECGHIGREGMSGRTVVLGSNEALTRIVMQVPGNGLIIKSELLVEAMQASRTLVSLMNRFVLANESQVAHTVLSTARFRISQRLARWLLMYHDRLDGDDMPVTHETLAMMLGVRRAGVTTEMHVLEGEQAVKSSRGAVRILDRNLLIEMAGGCYGAPEIEYERLIPSSLLDIRSSGEPCVDELTAIG